MKFYNVRPGTAVKLILREKGPRTQEELMTELVAGGAVVGKKRAAHNIRISIEKTLRNGTLKQVGDLIGLGEWDESMFRKSA
jgi:hypothetical protein